MSEVDTMLHHAAEKVRTLISAYSLVISLSDKIILLGDVSEETKEKYKKARIELSMVKANTK